ncbi:uncharacterized protein L969DRAFT_34171, partial [Mixia osmundae IAM 14324]
WIRPLSRPEAIDALIAGVDRYNPSNFTLLEAYVTSQVNDRTYDPLANLAILKLVQFNPDLVPQEEPAMIYTILLKAIAHQPFGSDYGLCLALLADRFSTLYSTQETLDIFRSLSHFSALLNARQFQQFWSELRAAEISAKLAPALSTVPSIEDILRESIARSVVSAFRSISLVRLNSWLGLSGDQVTAPLEAIIKSQGWSLDGHLIRLPTTPENDPKATLVKEEMALEKLSKLLRSS